VTQIIGEITMCFECNAFIVEDCETAMKRISDDSINFILTSPPYADQRNYGESGGRIDPEDYLNWFLPKAKEIYRILKPDGSFVLNINDKIVGSYQHLYVFRLVVALCDIIGFHLVRDYIWYNPATPPNVFSRGTMGRTKKSHEYCFWFSKSERWYFNLDAIRTPYGKAMEKYLAGKGKGARDANIRPSTHNFNCAKVWADHGGADPGSVIEISNTASNDVFMRLCKSKGIKHPARFPYKLSEFFIKSGTREGDIVLDPFAGSGTTIVAAAKLKRKWVYIDTNAEYCELAKEWLQIELQSVQERFDGV
jgi:DNA modification methylase